MIHASAAEAEIAPDPISKGMGIFATHYLVVCTTRTTLKLPIEIVLN
jgi:hypothetical protein